MDTPRQTEGHQKGILYRKDDRCHFWIRFCSQEMNNQYPITFTDGYYFSPDHQLHSPQKVRLNQKGLPYYAVSQTE